MKYTCVLPLALCSLLLGCADSSLEGDVFITRESGDVVPLAGGTVYLLPVDSEKTLIHQLAAKARRDTQSEVSDRVATTCQNATGKILQAISNKVKAIDNIRNDTSVPEAGCDALTTELERATDRLLTQEAGYNRQLATLNASLTDASNARHREIASKAAQLEKAATQKVTITQISQKGGSGGGSVHVTIKNSSDYCIVGTRTEFPPGFTINLFANRDKVGQWVARSSSQDENGVEIPCDIPPNSHKAFEGNLSINVIFPELDEIVSAIEQGWYQGFKPVDGELQPKITGASLSDYALHRLSSLGVSGGKKYRTNKVDWQMLALTQYAPDKHDRKIAGIKTKIATLEEERERALSSISDDGLRLTDQTRQCELAARQLVTLRAEKQSLEKLHADLGACEAVPLQINTLMTAMDAANSAMDTDFKLPDPEAVFASKVLDGFSAFLDSGTGYQVDTTIKGAYSIPGIKNGKYLMFAQYRDNRLQGFWMDPVRVDAEILSLEKALRKDLSTKGFVAMPVSVYLSQQASKVCQGCKGGDISLMDRRELVNTYNTTE